MRHSIAGILAIAFLLVACENNNSNDLVADSHPTVIELQGNTRSAVESCNTFGLGLTSDIIRRHPDTNFAISPLGLMIGLSMVANGADDELADEIVEAFGLQPGSESLNTLNEYCGAMMAQLPKVDRTTDCILTNGLFVDPEITVKNDFVKNLSLFYNAEVKNVSPAGESGMDAINDWIASATRKAIPLFLNSPIDSPLSLINALYFKGIWQKPFVKSDTQVLAFKNMDGSTVEVPFMNQTENLLHYKDNKAQYVHLPYSNGNFVMTLILPNEGESIYDIFRFISTDGFSTTVTSSKVAEITLSMPRFTINTGAIEISDYLVEAGVPHLKTSLLNKITDSNLTISEIKHGVVISVDEKGTEAASATLTGMEISTVFPKVSLKFDRPFAFVIHETTTNTILFGGQVTDLKQ